MQPSHNSVLSLLALLPKTESVIKSDDWAQLREYMEVLRDTADEVIGQIDKGEIRCVKSETLP